MNGRSLLGDCLELTPTHVADKSVQLVLADLPFGLTKHPADKPIPMNDFILYKHRGVERPLSKEEFFAVMANKKASDIAPEIWDLGYKKGLWSNFNRVLTDNGAVALFCQGKFFIDLVNSNPKNFRYDLVWDKGLITGFLNSSRMPLRQHETVAIFYNRLPVYNPQMTLGKKLHSKGTKYSGGDHVNQNYGKFVMTDDSRAGSRDKYPTSILRVRKSHPSVALHRTEKPVQLLEWFIRTFTNPGDIVFDPVAGSFSTAEACINTSRRFIVMEKDPEEFAKGSARISNHVPQLF